MTLTPFPPYNMNAFDAVSLNTAVLFGIHVLSHCSNSNSIHSNRGTQNSFLFPCKLMQALSSAQHPLCVWLHIFQFFCGKYFTRVQCVEFSLRLADYWVASNQNKMDLSSVTLCEHFILLGCGCELKCSLIALHPPEIPWGKMVYLRFFSGASDSITNSVTV